MANTIGVSYHYFEGSPEYKKNFQHFLTFGCHPSLDVVCAIAGPHTVDLPALPNVRYEFIENKNFDYGGHAHVVNTHFIHNQHSHLVFVNSSVRGPFIAPAAAALQAPGSCWANALVGLLKPGVGLAGSTINVVPETSKYCTSYRALKGGAGPASHVQSTVYAMPRSTLELLHGGGFFTLDAPLEKDRLIAEYEIHLSQCLLVQGLNIASLLPEYNGIDYTQPHTDPNPTSKGGDPFFHNAYFGRTPHPYETLFSKTNRDLYPAYYLDMLAHGMASAGLAHAECGLPLDASAFLAEKNKGELVVLRYALKRALWPKLDPRQKGRQ